MTCSKTFKNSYSKISTSKFKKTSWYAKSKPTWNTSETVSVYWRLLAWNSTMSSMRRTEMFWGTNTICLNWNTRPILTCFQYPSKKDSWRRYRKRNLSSNLGMRRTSSQCSRLKGIASLKWTHVRSGTMYRCNYVSRYSFKIKKRTAPSIKNTPSYWMSSTVSWRSCSSFLFSVRFLSFAQTMHALTTIELTCWPFFKPGYFLD